MLKVYAFCLDSILVIDTEKNNLSIVYAVYLVRGQGEEKAKDKTRKITKATVNKHVRQYGKFVVGIPILNEYAPAHLMSFDVKKGYIGEFEDWVSLQKFFMTLAETSKPFFDNYSSCNDWADVIEAYVKVKRGLTDWEKDFFLRHIADEKSCFHTAAKREKALLDLLSPLLEGTLEAETA